jgi:hypothetical protein
MIWLSLLWIIGTLLFVSVVVLLAKKYGPEYIIGLYAAVYVVANILVSKLVVIGPFTTTAGVIAFSLTFFLTDALTEFHGKRYAKKAVWIGFIAQLFLVFAVFIAINWTPSSEWTNQEAYVAVLGNTWRLVLASLVTYIISQHFDIKIYSLLKKKTKGKQLWLRNNVSTMLSQGVDTVLFTSLAFVGILPLSVIGSIIFGEYVIKLCIAALDTPFLYVIGWARSKFFLK